MITISRSHLTYEKRCQISSLLQAKKSNREIAKIVGISHSAVNRELSKNGNKYDPKKAHEKAKKRKSLANTRPFKIKGQVAKYVNQQLLFQQWSPKQISGSIKKNNNIAYVSHQSIYRHVSRDRKSGGLLSQNLRRKNKPYNKKAYCNAGRKQIPGRVDIKQREPIVDQKVRFGDFEIDLIIGKSHKGAIVTIVDRFTLLTLLTYVPSKKADVVSEAIIEKLKIFRPIGLHTITTDNGKEFSAHQRIAQYLGVNFYFATPYRSCERGLVENTNGLIRQYFPKKTSFAKISSRDLLEVQLKLNSRPRETLGYKTPYEAFCSATSQI